jgi:hypothetical protein
MLAREEHEAALAALPLVRVGDYTQSRWTPVGMGALIGRHGNKVVTAYHNTLLRDRHGQLAYEAETVCVSTPPPQRYRIQAEVEFADPESDVAVLGGCPSPC